MAPLPALPAPRPVTDPEADASALRRALATLVADLEHRAARAPEGPAADVLFAQAQMASDPALAEQAAKAVRQGTDPAHALSATFDGFRTRLLAAGGYFAERAADLDDLCGRAIAHLLGLPVPGLPDPGHPYILVADDLAPADTALLDPTRVLALVTARGGPTSHTAILAKALGLPAVVGCSSAADLKDGRHVLVHDGTVEVDPSSEAVSEAARREQRRRSRAAAVHGPGRTSDSHPVALLVNLGAPHELPRAAAADAEGVGLFRTEFLYLDRTEPPALDEQAAAYRGVFNAFSGRRVVVRTLDAGADKPLPFATASDEENPALGVRGLRTAARDPRLLDTQLAAIAKAAGGSDADVWVMAPMVSLPEEAAEFAARVH
jgi:phosphotransferase system enzyme I (PtsI)